MEFQVGHPGGISRLTDKRSNAHFMKSSSSLGPSRREPHYCHSAQPMRTIGGAAAEVTKLLKPSHACAPGAPSDAAIWLEIVISPGAGHRRIAISFDPAERPGPSS
jgi:hypothetical protein